MRKFSPENYILYLLSRRDYSEREIEDRMHRKGYDPEEIQSSIKFFKQKNLISDKRFAENLVKNRKSNKGRFYIAEKLQQAGIDQETLKEAMVGLTEEDELNAAKEQVQKWLRSHGPTDEKTKERVLRFLAGKGFGYDISKKIVDNLT